MAGRHNFTFEQGASWRRRLTWYTDESQTTPVDLTGFTARMQVRRHAKSLAWLSLTDGAGITLGGTAGTIDIVVTDEQTALLPLSGVYDLEVESAGGEVTRLLEGEARVRKEVTR